MSALDWSRLELNVATRLKRHQRAEQRVPDHPDRQPHRAPLAELGKPRHRPIGLGVQGLADAFILMRMPFESPEAAKLNTDIFETFRAMADALRERQLCR